jgi:hypothetical protein
MRIELDVERAVEDDELARAIANALVVDRERLEITASAAAGDFARRVVISGPDGVDRIAFYRALAQLLATRLLVDDGEGAMLVTADEVVRVNVDANGAISGLREYAETDDVPDRLVLESTIYRTTRGQALARAIEAVPHDAAALAAYTPDVQDALHTLTEALRALVDRTATPEDERALRRTCAILRRAFPVPGAAETFMSDILCCADNVLAAPWDPHSST